MITLRPYQEAAVNALFGYFGEAGGNPIVVLPTGSGKSVVIAEFVRRAIAAYPDTKVLVLSHVAELLTQDLNELLAVWPEAPAGLHSASLKSRDTKAQIIFGGIQSIHNKAYALQRIDLVIIDECHLLSPNGNSMYRKFLTDLAQINPYLKVIGLTATCYRLDSGSLISGDEALFTDIAYEAPLLDMIKAGYLCPLVSQPTATALDVSGVKMRGGEYVAGELERAVDKDSITQAAVDEIVRFGADRRSWMVFCSGVAHARHVRDAIQDRGITCETITGETPAAERAATLAGFRDGVIRAVTNANVLTTGINIKPIDLLAFLRPTKSAALYVQMAGRAMRTSPETGKENGLVLDFARVVATHGPVDKVKQRPPGKGDGDAPVKKCPGCEEMVFASARKCPCCGYQFPPPTSKLQETAAVLPVLSTQKAPAEWLDVEITRYTRHAKPGKIPSMCVTYQCGMVWRREWICFEHEGYARTKAVSWWQKRAPGIPVPDTVDEALEHTHAIKQPRMILVRPVDKFFEITGVSL